jgi:mono/diheme cytochrome c family protein
MKTAYSWIAAFVLSIALVACADLIDGPFHGRDHDDDDTVNTDTTGGNDTTHHGSGDTTKIDSTVCFSRDILPILISNCAMAKCHDEASHKDGVVLTTYASVMREVKPGNLDDSELYDVITKPSSDEIMPPPPGKLTASQIQLIAQWIREGAKNRDCSSEGNCNTTNVTYTNTIAPMLATWCTGCHGASSPSAGIDLTDRAVVEKQVRSGALVGTITHAVGFAKMPPSGAKMDDCSISKVQAWIANGLQ